MPAPVCVIVNPAAGGGRAARVADDVMRALSGHGLSARRADATDVFHAQAVARGAALAGETVAVLGGDGMIGTVADALRDVPGAVLGVLPAGRGNDLARVLGIPKDPLAACATIAQGVSVAMDLGEVWAVDHGGEVAQGEDRSGARTTFVGIASAGFDSDANRIANQATPRLGRLVYAYGALRALLGWRPVRFEVELDPPGERRAFVGCTVAAANSRAYGGGMFLAPQALLDDGMLDVVTIAEMGRLRFAWSLRLVFRGTHVDLPAVQVARASEIEISADRPVTLYADGDPIAALPVRVRALQGAVRVLIPPAQTAAGESAAGAIADRASPFSAPGTHTRGRFGQPAPQAALTDDPRPAAP